MIFNMGKRKKKAKEEKSIKEDVGHTSEPLKSPRGLIGQEEPFDFGGIPQRNLKSNLGCG
jgi:hypothetical protein